MGRNSPRGRPRPQRNRQRHRRILVVIGGLVTEKDYLTRINREAMSGGVTLEIGKSGRDPVSLVREAAARAAADRREARLSDDRNNTYDAVWVVFDVDDFGEQVTEAATLAHRSGVQCAISNPCFEIWLLWHVSDKASHTSTRSAQDAAARAGVVAGKGNKYVQLPVITGKYAAARKRAVDAENMHARAERKYPDTNPSSNTYQLIDSIVASCRKARPGTSLAL
ncbi:RloB domain-containing protein [Clavibacter michiganensis subsp. michiganensis]|uniref:RloB family protein n=1 Tax=Clavibacter michiganensis TaxID=28447 RepID=UPI001C645DD4|nr:RloB domain-containing protein [Clavibacter michiganensis subsp. michiganensis]